MRYNIISALLAVLLLSGCSQLQQPKPQSPHPEVPATGVNPNKPGWWNVSCELYIRDNAGLEPDEMAYLQNRLQRAYPCLEWQGVPAEVMDAPHGIRKLVLNLENHPGIDHLFDAGWANKPASCIVWTDQLPGRTVTPDLWIRAVANCAVHEVGHLLGAQHETILHHVMTPANVRGQGALFYTEELTTH